MIGLPTHLIGATSAIFLAASLVPGSLDSSPLDDTPPRGGEIVSTKGDKLSRSVAVSERSTVSVVELVGVSQTAVILRDRDGKILFQSDPLTNTTLIARDVDLPVITLKQEERSPVLHQEPAPRREGNQPPPASGRKSKPFGCEGAVSPLAKGHNGTPSLCLASLGDPATRS
jgi:hypothetical protein